MRLAKRLSFVMILVGVLLMTQPHSRKVNSSAVIRERESAAAKYVPSARSVNNKAQASPAAQSKAAIAYGNLPLRFEKNVGQLNEAVQFLARTPGSSIFLAGSEAVFTLHSRNSQQSV